MLRVRQLDQTTLEVDGDRSPEAVLPLVRRMLGVDVDLSEALQLAAAGSRLASVVQHFRGLRPPRFGSLFETLAMTIPFQQVSLEAGQSFVNRLVERFGKSRGALWLFPTPAAIANASIEDLRAAGLSAAKATTLRHAASLIVAVAPSEAEIERLPSDEALRLLEGWSLRDKTEPRPRYAPWGSAGAQARGLGRECVVRKGRARPEHLPPSSGGSAMAQPPSTSLQSGLPLSMVSGACPVAVMKCAQWRPADLPDGGQKNCPESEF